MPAGLHNPNRLANAVRTFTPVSANTTLDNTYQAVGVDCTGAARTITLPPVASYLNKEYTIIKTDATANPVIIDANASETINGFLIHLLTYQYDRTTFVGTATGWINMTGNLLKVSRTLVDLTVAADTPCLINPLGSGRIINILDCFLEGETTPSGSSKTSVLKVGEMIQLTTGHNFDTATANTLLPAGDILRVGDLYPAANAVAAPDATLSANATLNANVSTGGSLLTAGRVYVILPHIVV